MVTTIFVPPVPKEIEKDGKKIKLVAPPQIVLMEKGPVAKVRIAKPPVSEGIAPIGMADTIEVYGVIDTGASSTVITPDIALKLGLIQTGWQSVGSVHSKEDRPVYFASLWFPWGSAMKAKVISCNLHEGVQCLIGRDVMMNWSFTYNGKDGFYTICD
jgi:hypothetical protein